MNCDNVIHSIVKMTVFAEMSHDYGLPPFSEMVPVPQWNPGKAVDQRQPFFDVAVAMMPSKEPKLPGGFYQVHKEGTRKIACNQLL